MGTINSVHQRVVGRLRQCRSQAGIKLSHVSGCDHPNLHPGRLLCFFLGEEPGFEAKEGIRSLEFGFIGKKNRMVQLAEWWR